MLGYMRFLKFLSKRNYSSLEYIRQLLLGVFTKVFYKPTSIDQRVYVVESVDRFSASYIYEPVACSLLLKSKNQNIRKQITSNCQNG